MSFKDAKPKFYEGDHAEIYALVSAQALFGNLGDRADDDPGYREVKLNIVPREDGREAFPLMDVTVFSSEEVLPTSFLPVLGVKLKPEARKWIRATSVHPQTSNNSVSLVARPPSRKK